MKKLFNIFYLLIIVLALSSCTKSAAKKEYFKLWNKDCESIKALKEYVEDVTNEKSSNFIPVEDRIVTFDMDGTFVGELYPSYFEYNLLEYRVLDDVTYKDKASESEVEAATAIRDFVRNGKALPDHFDMIHAYAAAKAYAGMTYGESFYKPMLEIFDYLEDYDFTYYVVSGSDRFICRALVKSIGIEPNRVIGMDVVLKTDKQGDAEGVNYTMGSDEILIRTDELIIKNLKTNKVKQITQEIGKKPVLSFGNSGGDSAMHNYCLSNEYKSAAFMLIADDDEDDHANREKALNLGKQWKEAGYHVISMKDDFKTIYGENVKKVDFVFE